MFIKGCIGFVHSQGKYGEMLLVRGKCVIEVPLTMAGLQYNETTLE